MRTSVKTLIVASAFAAALFGAQALMAHQESGGMMGGGSMMSQGGGMKGMMGMMAQMSQMMDTCNKMMQEHHGESQKSTQGATKKDKKQ